MTVHNIPMSEWPRFALATEASPIPLEIYDDHGVRMGMVNAIGVTNENFPNHLIRLSDGTKARLSGYVLDPNHTRFVRLPDISPVLPKRYKFADITPAVSTDPTAPTAHTADATDATDADTTPDPIMPEILALLRQLLTPEFGEDMDWDMRWGDTLRMVYRPFEAYLAQRQFPHFRACMAHGPLMFEVKAGGMNKINLKLVFEGGTDKEWKDRGFATVFKRLAQGVQKSGHKDAEPNRCIKTWVFRNSPESREQHVRTCGDIIHVLAPVVGRWFEDIYEIDGSELGKRIEEDRAEQNIRDNPHLPATQKTQLIQSRIGQGLFRRNIRDRECRVTGVAHEPFLIASHIKPWRFCDDRERLDGDNGLLLFPNIDFLFDRGFITFEDDGSLTVSPELNLLLGRIVMDPANIHSHQKFTERQKGYLKYHREEVFEKWSR